MFYLLFIGDHIHSDWSTILLGFVSNLPFSVWRVDISIKHINQLVVHEWRIITLTVFTFTPCNESYIYFICREHTKIHLFFSINGHNLPPFATIDIPIVWMWKYSGKCFVSRYRCKRLNFVLFNQIRRRTVLFTYRLRHMCHIPCFSLHVLLFSITFYSFL